MGRKNSRSSRQQRKNAGANTTNTFSADNQPMTSINVSDVTASTSQAEFDAKKETLIQQLMEAIESLEEEKTKAATAAQQAQKDLTKAEERKAVLISEQDVLQKKFDALQSDVAAAEATIRTSQEQAESIIAKADSYSSDVHAAADKEAEKIRKSAEAERLSVITKAADEARAQWQIQVDKLVAQTADIAEREAVLQEAQRTLKQDKQKMEDDREILQESKDHLQLLKDKYLTASPARLTALEAELTVERNKYDALKKQYQDLSKRYADLQAFMDTLKAQIEDPEEGAYIYSLSDLISSLDELKDKYDHLAALHQRYPDEEAVAAMEEKAHKTEKLQQEVDALIKERNRFREEASAAANASRELEVIRHEIDATKALNDHLLQELESHKTALESRTGDTCPALSKVDSETEAEDFRKDLANRTHHTELTSLQEIVTHVKNYAGSLPSGAALYYSEDDIRAFLAGMAVSRLIILQGMSGTGKSSLPRIFAQAISGFNRMIPVESSWRDRNELLGYYNDFNKKFNAKSFTIELYRSSRECCQDIPTFIVLDEMNLARIEYYFSDFLAILQEPDHKKWLIELVSSDMRTIPMELPDSVKAAMRAEDPSIHSVWERIERSRRGELQTEVSDEDKERLTAYLGKLGQLTGAKGLVDGRKIKVTDNIWFIGTANQDESTFEISDKVYDRAQVVSLNRKGVAENSYPHVTERYISADKLNTLFHEATANNPKRRDVEDRLNNLDRVLIEQFDVSFGNRIVTQTIDFVAVFVAAGGKLETALDYQISTKILRKVLNSDDEMALLTLQEAVKDYPETGRLIEKRMKALR